MSEPSPDNKRSQAAPAEIALRERLVGAQRASTGRRRVVGSKTRFPQRCCGGISPASPSWASLRCCVISPGLSQRNFSIESQFYPLGSCTMKYNPKINEVVARLPGFAQLHPLASPELLQGALALLYRARANACRNQRHGAREFAAFRRRARRTDRLDADSRLSDVSAAIRAKTSSFPTRPTAPTRRAQLCAATT